MAAAAGLLFFAPFLEAQSGSADVEVTTLAGLAGISGSTDGTGSAARFNWTRSVAVDTSGNIYVTDTKNDTIRKIAPGGVVTTFAGSAGSQGSIDDTGSAARFYGPRGVAVDGSGNVYVADTYNYTIRKITPGGIVTTFAGSTGNQGSTDGTGSAALFSGPRSVAVDGSGNVYVADPDNDNIRKITPGGVVTTFAGSTGISGSIDGVGTAAQFNLPYGVAADPSGNVYVADTANSTIRKITPDGVVTTLAGSALNAGSVDGTGSAAQLNFPYDLAVDSSGNIFVADTVNNTIRGITPGGVVTTLAGSALNVGSADGTGSVAQFNLPYGLAVDGPGNVYVADTVNNTVRKITPYFPEITVQPVSQKANPGDTVTFGVSATGAAPLAYQWYFNGWALAGATHSTLTITNAQLANAGRYYVLVSNPVSSVASNVVTLSGTGPAPTITAQSHDMVLTTGQPVTVSVTAGGTGTLTYQWYFNGQAIDGATGASYTITSMGAAQAGFYDVVIANGLSSTTSQSMQLAVAQTSITPASQVVDAEALSYQILVNSNVAWTATANANWVTLSRASGPLDANILVTVAANTTGADRTATIQVNGATNALTQRGTAIPELWGFGSDFNGQLGDNVLLQRVLPVQVLPGGVQALAAGANFSLIVKTDGSLWAMGYNGSGQLGDGTTTQRNSPVQILTSGVQGVAAGDLHSLIVKTDGSLWAMGYNGSGQLGDGTMVERTSPIQVLSGVQAVAAGAQHSLILKTNGSLWGMGDNTYGQLGDSTTTQRNSPVQILPGDVQAVAAGDLHSLILKTDGSLWAMGANWFGQLGDGTTTQRNSPVQILSGGVQAVAAGAMHSLIVKTDGSLWAMGDNFWGQLGDGTTTQRNSPVQILSGGVQAVVAGDNFSLIVKTDGSLWAMGYNTYGQLGDGTTTQRNSPVQILSGGVQAVAAGDYHSLIVKTDGSLWAMGYSTYGQLGDGTMVERVNPIQVLSGVQAVAAGDQHSLIVKTDGSLWAMGSNGSGELGDGTTTQRISPVQILLGGVQSVSAGGLHSLIVKTDGSLWAMGSNGSGELGDGTTTDRHSPVQILPNGVQAVAAGSDHSLVLKTDGSLWAMGFNGSGQLGDGTTTQRNSPVQILSGGVQSVSAGGLHSLIVKTDGSLWAMGSNGSGELGDGTTTDRHSPVQILPNGVQAIAAGDYHSLIVKTDGSLWAMGWNGSGQLGDGTTTQRNSPVQILSGGVQAVAAGFWHSLVLKRDGSLWAMGDNAYGQLGDGTTTQRIMPEPIAVNVQKIAAGASHSLIVTSGNTALHAPQITVQPVSQTTAAYGTVSFTAAASGAPAPSYQWQVSIDGGSTWNNLTNTAPYSGTTTGALTITGAIATMNGDKYRCVAANGVSPYAASNAATLTVNKAVPVITWPAPAPIPYGTALSATQLNATANVPGAFVYSPAAGAVLSGGGHTVHVYFTPTDTTDYTSATTIQVVTIRKAVPVITWPAPASITYPTALSATQLNATASVSGVLTYVPAAGTVLKGGTQTLKVYFMPTDSTDYAGTTATQTLIVRKAVPVITWAATAPITYGTALSAAQLNARASVTGTFVYSPAAGTVLSAGAHTLHATFTPHNTTNYANAMATQIVTVAKAVPVITWPAPAAIVYGTPLSATQLDATASVPGSFIYSPATGAVLKTGMHTLRAYFTPTDRTNYLCATATRTLTVNEASSQAFLQKLFKLVYGRPIDSTTLSTYLTAMSGGLTRAQVYGEMIRSPEYGARQIDPMIRLHYAALGRIPDYASLQKWSGALQAGTLTLTAAADQLASSADFVQRHGSLDNAQFVQELCRDLPGCEADSAGLAGRVAELDSGVSRGAMLLSLAESDEFKTGIADQLEIARLYCLLQQRMPTATELLVWQDFLLGDDQADDATAIQQDPDISIDYQTTLTDQFRATFLDDPSFAD